MKRKTETVRQALKRLPKWIEKRAIRNSTRLWIQDTTNRDPGTTESLVCAIAIAFWWSESPEKSDFWNAVCDRVESGKGPWPKLPKGAK